MTSPSVTIEPFTKGVCGFDFPNAMLRNGYTAEKNRRILHVPATWWLTRDRLWSSPNAWNLARYIRVFMRNFSMKYRRYAKTKTTIIVRIIAENGANLDIDSSIRSSICAALW